MLTDPSSRGWRRNAAIGIASVAILVAVAVAAYLILRVIPAVLAESERMSPADALERGRVRSGVLLFIGGLVAAAGASTRD